jgi:hypothetical protein
MTSDLNTILMAIALGVLGWNAYKTQELAAAIAGITQALRDGQEKFHVNDRDLIDLRARVVQCEIGLAQIKAICPSKPCA